MSVLLALFHHVDIEVRDPVVANLAALLELLQTLHRFLDRRVMVGPVDQHEVDEVGVQPTQTVFRVLNDVGLLRIPARHFRCVVVVEADLGHEHDLVAAIAQRLGQ